MPITNKKDIMLLLLYAPGVTEDCNEPIEGRTRFVKLLFLFKEEALNHFKKGTVINEENFYDYFPWKFGPFSKEVNDDLNFFDLRGIINIEKTSKSFFQESVEEFEQWENDTEIDEDADYFEETFSLTPKAEKFVEKHLWSDLNKQQKEILNHFKKQFIQWDLKYLLKYVYENYEQYTSHSTIKEQVLSK